MGIFQISKKTKCYIVKQLLFNYNVMDTLQIRLAPEIVKRIDNLVDIGIYSNRSDVIRDAVRKLVLDKMIGILPNTGDSVNEIREIRRKLSKEKFDLNELNKLVLVDLKRLYIEDNKGALGEDEVRRVWFSRLNISPRGTL